MEKIRKIDITKMLAGGTHDFYIEKWHQSKPYQYLCHLVGDGKIHKWLVSKRIFEWFNVEEFEPTDARKRSINTSYYKFK